MPTGELLRRSSPNHKVELLTRGDGKAPLITGYAAVFYDANDPGTEYRLADDLAERIMPTAFDRAVKEDDVRALFNHDDNAVLGRTSSGTLRLSVDRRGLKFEIDPPDTQCARELVGLIKRGDVTGCSFSFLPVANTYRSVDDRYIIERDDVDLFDVGPVTFPAYTATETSVRAVADREGARREVDAWKQTRDAFSRQLATARARAVETIIAESR